MSDPQTQNEEILTRNDEFDADDDDDPLNRSHRIVPKDHGLPSAETGQQENPADASATAAAAATVTEFRYDLNRIFTTDNDTYLYAPIPKDHIGFVSCRVTRHTGFSPIYHLYFERQNENDLTFLLAARRHRVLNGHAEYFIGVDKDASKNLNDGNSVALLKAMNIIGSEYVLYDQRFCSTRPQNKEQLGAILYDERLFGSKEPRKLTVLLRDPEKPIDSAKEHEALISQWQSGHATEVIVMKNKPPEYNQETKKFALHFIENRIKLPSHKNFQLCLPSTGNDEGTIVMQFGRIDENNFALDYRYPLSAIQAFAIGLSSFHNRFRS